MKIAKAKIEDAEKVKCISHETINAVYPRYYPQGAVDFFLAHHSISHISKDIGEGCVWLIYDEEKAVGTVTVNGNEINRLFVLPEYQGKGFGRELMRFAESIVFDRWDTSELSASLPAKAMYMKNGYEFSEYNIIDCNNGDKLCYDYMIKRKS